MTKDIKISKSLDDITDSLRSFIELSLKEDDKTWGEWISSVAKDVEVRCWEVKNCQKTDCTAYKSLEPGFFSENFGPMGVADMRNPGAGFIQSRR